jgi:branched-subunit amino acid aminotransferase/4-amino-4-deoxychorismate lyase
MTDRVAIDRVPIDRVAIDGRPAGAGDLGLVLAARYGHFTAMQVRGGGVRGLDLHLARLASATEELFGVPLDLEVVRASVREALGGERDAAVRVYVLDRHPSGRSPHVVATAAPPLGWPAGPRALLPVAYERFLPHVKHLGGFPQMHLVGRAKAEGFDDALLTGAGGLISESAIANLGCFDGELIVWPDAPMLFGTAMGLLERAGVPCERRPLTVAGLAGRPLVFLANSWGLTPVGRVGDLALEPDEKAVERLSAIYESTPWDPVG